MDDLRDEFRQLTRRYNEGTATAEEYERWCELRAELRRTDIPTRRMRLRTHPRAGVDLQVELTIRGHRRTVRCLDFGPGGMGLEVPEPLAADEHVTIRFQLPDDDEHWHVRARVMWYDEGRRQCGVKFEQLSLEQLDELQAATLAEHVLRGLRPRE